MLYQVVAYSNTGFSPINVPDSQALLKQMQSTTFDGLWLLQDLAQGTIRVKATWDTVRQVDYVAIDNTFYFCTGVRMVNENNAELVLQLDALTTIGINNLVINSGWCTRRHVLSDGLFENVIDEEWGATEPPVQDLASVNVSSADPATILASQVSLETNDLQYICDTYKNPTSPDSSVNVPRVSTIAEPTTCTMDVGSTTFTKEVPSTGLYVLKYAGGDYSESLNNKVQVIRSLGLDSAIAGCYNVPADYLTKLERPGDKSQYSLLGSSYLTRDTGLGFTWAARSGYTVRNNKVFSGQYSKFSIVSPTSGDRTDFDAHDIYNGGGNLQVGLFADVAPGGKPYCRPTQYLGLNSDGLNGFVGVTEGSQWQNAPFQFQLASGATTVVRQGQQRWGIAENRLITQGQQIEDMKSSAFANILSSGLSLGSQAGGSSLNPLSLVGGLVNSVNSSYLSGRNIAYAERAYANDEMNLQYDKFNTMASVEFVSPEVKFPRAPSLQDYVGNGFYVVHTHLSPNDTERFDRYLTMFGYRVNEILSIGCFYGRQYFNYVQAQSIDITVPSGTPLRVKMRAIEQLTQGVRVWHIKPSNVYFNNNPIV